MNIRIINIHVEKPKGYLYIGRDGRNHLFNFGNPFTHVEHGTFATRKVATREDAVQAFEDWLRGTAWHDVEPTRRAWILRQIDELAAADKDITMGCFCKPRACHGDVLAKMIEEARHNIEYDGPYDIDIEDQSVLFDDNHPHGIW